MEQNDIFFHDRRDAGLRLAEALKKFKGEESVVYALPRGGVVLGAVIAEKLECPLDVVITRKIGHPLNPEYAICAISQSGQLVCNEAEKAALDQTWFNEALKRETEEAKRRHEKYRAGHSPISAKGKTAILVDDGIATGLTMRAALREIRQQEPAKIIVAVPVAPRDTAERLRQEADELISLAIPEYFLGAIGAYYAEFSQVSDEEVVALLKRR